MKLTTLALAASLLFPKPGDCMENPSIVIYKADRKLELYSGDKLVKEYKIGLGLDPVTAKVKQGDYATPEGTYYVCRKNPNSTYYMALILAYPNKEDADRGLKDKIIGRREHSKIVQAIDAGKCPPFNTKLGGLIEIHGNGSDSDWTWGCIALNDPEIKELYKQIPVGTRVTIEP